MLWYVCRCTYVHYKVFYTLIIFEMATGKFLEELPMERMGIKGGREAFHSMTFEIGILLYINRAFQESKRIIGTGA